MAIIFFSTIISCKSDDSPTPPVVIVEPEPEPVIDENFDNLVWSDDFNDDGAPDSGKWAFELGDGCPNLCGWGNQEAQYYTDRPENIVIENGVLKIIAKRESLGGSSFTSARIKTQGKFEFTYGKIEVRAKLPFGDGTWPAIWMLGSNINSVGWPRCGEMDIMEHAGKNLGKISSAIHTVSSSGNTVNKGEITVSNVESEFHIYGLRWTREKLEFSVDGNVYYTYNPASKNVETWPFTEKQFLLLNVAMGGTFGGNIDSNFTESSMEIDYVKVYQ